MNHVLEFENYQVVPTQECFMIKPLRKIYTKDRTKNKEEFMRAITIVYFMADPRSTYNYILDEEDRLKAILEEEGVEKGFKLTDDIKEAILVYKKHTITSSQLALEDAKYAVEKLRKTMRAIDFDSMEEKDKANAAKTVASIISMLPKIVKDLQDTEKVVAKEIEEQGRARGGSEKTITDDGFAGLFN